MVFWFCLWKFRQRTTGKVQATLRKCGAKLFYKKEFKLYLLPECRSRNTSNFCPPSTARLQTRAMSSRFLSTFLSDVLVLCLCLASTPPGRSTCGSLVLPKGRSEQAREPWAAASRGTELTSASSPTRTASSTFLFARSISGQGNLGAEPPLCLLRSECRCGAVSWDGVSQWGEGCLGYVGFHTTTGTARVCRRLVLEQVSPVATA